VGVVAKCCRHEVNLPTPGLLLQSKVVFQVEVLLSSVWEIKSLDTQKLPCLKNILDYSEVYWRILRLSNNTS
jgi:hypothetical protein